MNARADQSFSTQVDESPVGAAEDETADFVSSLLPYMGVTLAVAIVVISALIAVTAHVLHF